MLNFYSGEFKWFNDEAERIVILNNKIVPRFLLK